MKQPLNVYLGYLLAGLVALLTIGYFALVGFSLLRDDVADLPLDATQAFEVMQSLLFGAVGTLIVTKRRGNPVGIALLVTGVGLASYKFFRVFTDMALQPDAPFGGAALGATFYSAIWPLIVAGMFLLMLFFPSGKLPGRFWRLLLYPFGLAMVVEFLGYFLIPYLLEPPYKDLRGPLVVDALEGVNPFPFAVVLLLSTAAASINLFYRFRKSRGEEREQFRWLVLAGVLVIPSTILTSVDDQIYGMGSNLQAFSFAGLPVAVGIAVLRYRLYDIDRILNRTAVYGLLTVALAGLYFGLVVAMQAVFRSVSGTSDLAIALTTLIVAALFLPARRRVQTVVDRRFNRRAYNAARTLESFSQRLRQNTDLDTLRYDLLALVDETMAPRQVTLWLKSQGERP